MRNYWALLPAIAVIIGLILLYAIPTLINPQWTSSILALFRQFPEDAEPAPDQAHGQAQGQAQNQAQNQAQHQAQSQAPGQAQQQGEQAQRPAGILGPQQIKSRRMLAGVLVAAAVGLFGFNVSLNREANACYQAAKAWGASDGKPAEDPCINMIYGSFFGDGQGEANEDTQQPVKAYQVVHKKKPTYLRWIQNAPKYDEADLLVGTGLSCNLDLRIMEEEDKVVVLVDANQPCPNEDNVSLTAFKLKKPLGDRQVVTVDDKPMERINPDVDSWPTVVKKLITGG
ncbi:hypothetical protein [Kribbella steppae]|uniref:hypothetical protein n=1 Tax=Kribbella steppae TaxID=2512223 RepID=UPI0018EE5D9C|nr:hypothetical protein [Kribbella steppae]